jgi:hypothetical protein
VLGLAVLARMLQNTLSAWPPIWLRLLGMRAVIPHGTIAASMPAASLRVPDGEVAGLFAAAEPFRQATPFAHTANQSAGIT